MADLIIKINGDIKNYQAALDDARKQTEDFSGSMEKLSIAAGAAFASVSLAVGYSIEKYREQELAANELVSAMQQQGIYSKELADDYTAQAEAISKKTGIDKDQIIQGQALLQSQIGQTKITKELTQAVVDLAARKRIDLASAFDLVAKATNENVTILKRYGITVQEGATRAETLANIQKELSGNFAGSAEAAAGGLGVWSKVKDSFDEVAKKIGEDLAPAFILVGQKVNDFLNTLKENKPLVDLIASLLVAGGTVSALVLGIGLASAAFAQFKAAMVAAGVATEAMTIGVRALIGSTGIGLLIVVVTEVALNWNSVWPRMQATFEAFVATTTQLLSAFGKILRGAFTLNLDLLKQGIAEATTALQTGVKTWNTTMEEHRQQQIKADQQAEETKLANNNKFGAQREAQDADRRTRQAAARQAEKELALAQANEESKEMIAIKRDEAETLKKLADDNNLAIRSQLQDHFAKLKAMEAQQRKDDASKEKIFNQQILRDSKEFNSLSEQERQQFLATRQRDIQGSLDTEATARQKWTQQEVQRDVQTHNTFLQNQIRFGKAYATLYQVMHSEIYQGFAKADSDLVALQNSHNSTLKEIGKVAAIAQITIKTAEAAMNIYEGFSTIPIIGPALGIAAAAAAIAYGAEQISDVNSANQGGIVPGSGPDRDSVLSYLTPGELVVPRSNFDEVVTSVANSRGAGIGGSDGSGSGPINIVLSLKDNLMDFIEIQTNKRKNLGISYQGA